MKLKSFAFTTGIAVSVVVAGVTTPTSVRAATLFTNSTAFVNNLQSGFYLENFEGLAVASAPTTFSVNGFSYTTTAPGDTLYVNPATANSTKALSTDTAGAGIAINFTSGNVTAVGGNFFLSDFGANPVAGNLTINLSDGTSEIVSSVASSNLPFRGFTTTGSTFITSLNLLPFTATAPFQFNTLDNLYVGQAQAQSTAVPEPFTIIGTLVGGTAALRMRKQLKAAQKV